MALMEMLHTNFLETTTMVIPTSNTAGSEFLFDKNKNVVYRTSDYTSNTSSLISIELGTSTVIDTIILQNINLKQFRIFYNSVTATVFSPNLSYTQNSDTSLFLQFATQAVNSIQIQLDTAITADTEKQIGEIIVTRRLLQFERNPSIDNFDLQKYKKQIRHEMPDGGISVYNVSDKYKTSIGWQFITETFYQSLLNIYNTGSSLYFAPFPTSASWDGVCFEAVWTGNFNFKFSSNVKTVGYSGSLTLEETPSR